MNSLLNKVALVTGAGSGIGKAISLSLAREGVKVILLGRNKDKLVATKNEILSNDGVAEILVCDLTNDSLVFNAVDNAYSIFNGLDILVNNAGMTLNCPFESTNIKDYDKIMALNSRAPFILSQSAIKYLKNSNHAVIVNIASVVAHQGYPNQSAYSASKHALLGWTKSLAGEVYKDGIRVHAVSPGGVYTDMVAISRPDLSKDGMIMPSDVADSVLFLIKNRSNAVIDEIQIHRSNKAPF